MTVAVFLISFLLFLSFLLTLQGAWMASIVPTTLLGALAFRQAYLLRRGHPAQAVLDGAPLRRVLHIALPVVMERIDHVALKHGLSAAAKRKDFMEDVHLLPILSAAIREQFPNDPRATSMAQEAEGLYDFCTRPSE